MDTYSNCTDLRKTMARFATGITIISTPECKGFTCTAFLSVSLDPPLVAFTAMERSNTFDYIVKHQLFGVNILGDHQEDLVHRFANREITDRFEGVKYFLTDHDVPIISNGMAWLVCKVHSITPVGDHHLVVGEVIQHGVSGNPNPVIFFDSSTTSVNSL